MDSHDMTSYPWGVDPINFTLESLDCPLTPPPQSLASPCHPQHTSHAHVLASSQQDPSVALLVPPPDLAALGHESAAMPAASAARPHSPYTSWSSGLAHPQDAPNTSTIPAPPASAASTPHDPNSRLRHHPYETATTRRPAAGAAPPTPITPAPRVAAQRNADISDPAAVAEAGSGTDTDANIDADVLPTDYVDSNDDFAQPEASHILHDHIPAVPLRSVRAAASRSAASKPSPAKESNHAKNVDPDNNGSESTTVFDAAAPTPHSPSRSATASRFMDGTPRRASSPSAPGDYAGAAPGAASASCSPLIYKSEDALVDGLVLGDLRGTTAARSRKMSESERNIMLLKRRLRNRQSAARSREKQRHAVNDLTEKVGELSERLELALRENAHLRDQNAKLAAALAKFERFP